MTISKVMISLTGLFTHHCCPRLHPSETAFELDLDAFNLCPSGRLEVKLRLYSRLLRLRESRRGTFACDGSWYIDEKDQEMLLTELLSNFGLPFPELGILALDSRLRSGAHESRWPIKLKILPHLSPSKFGAAYNCPAGVAQAPKSSLFREASVDWHNVSFVSSRADLKTYRI